MHEILARRRAARHRGGRAQAVRAVVPLVRCVRSGGGLSATQHRLTHPPPPSTLHPPPPIHTPQVQGPHAAPARQRGGREREWEHREAAAGQAHDAAGVRGLQLPKQQHPAPHCIGVGGRVAPTAAAHAPAAAALGPADRRGRSQGGTAPALPAAHGAGAAARHSGPATELHRRVQQPLLGRFQPDAGARRGELLRLGQRRPLGAEPRVPGHGGWGCGIGEGGVGDSAGRGFGRGGGGGRGGAVGDGGGVVEGQEQRRPEYRERWWGWGQWGQQPPPTELHTHYDMGTGGLWRADR